MILGRQWCVQSQGVGESLQFSSLLHREEKDGIDKARELSGSRSAGIPNMRVTLRILEIPSPTHKNL